MSNTDPQKPSEHAIIASDGLMVQIGRLFNKTIDLDHPLSISLADYLG